LTCCDLLGLQLEEFFILIRRLGSTAQTADNSVMIVSLKHRNQCEILSKSANCHKLWKLFRVLKTLLSSVSFYFFMTHSSTATRENVY